MENININKDVLANLDDARKSKLREKIAKGELSLNIVENEPIKTESIKEEIPTPSYNDVGNVHVAPVPTNEPQKEKSFWDKTKNLVDKGVKEINTFFKTGLDGVETGANLLNPVASYTGDINIVDDSEAKKKYDEGKADNSIIQDLEALSKIDIGLIKDDPEKKDKFYDTMGNILNKRGYDLGQKDNGELVAIDDKGKELAIKNDFWESLLDGIKSDIGELGGATYGAKKGFDVARKVPTLYGKAAAIAGGSLVGAVTGNSLDMMVNDLKDREKLNWDEIGNELGKSAVLDVAGNAVGYGVIKTGGKAIDFLGATKELITKGNIEGAREVLEKDLGISKEYVDDALVQLKNDYTVTGDRRDPWEKYIIGSTDKGGKFLGLSNPDKIDKQDALLATALKNGDTETIKAAISGSETAAINIGNMVNERTKGITNLLEERASKVGGEELKNHLINVEEKASKDFKNMRQNFDEAFKETDFNFELKDLKLDTVFEDMAKRVQDPDATGRFLELQKSINNTFKNSNANIGIEKDINAILDLRQQLNRFIGKNENYLSNAKDKQTFSALKENIDNQIQKAVDEYLPKNLASNLMSDFSKSMQQYREVGALEDNPVFNAIMGKADKPKFRMDKLIEHMADDDSYVDNVLSTFKPQEREVVETAIIRDITESYTGKTVEGDMGKKAIAFEDLGKKLSSIKRNVRSELGKELIENLELYGKKFGNTDLVYLDYAHVIKVAPSASIATSLTGKIGMEVSNRRFEILQQMLPTDNAKRIALQKHIRTALERSRTPQEFMVRTYQYPDLSDNSKYLLKKEINLNNKMLRASKAEQLKILEDAKAQEEVERLKNQYPLNDESIQKIEELYSIDKESVNSIVGDKEYEYLMRNLKQNKFPSATKEIEQKYQNKFYELNKLYASNPKLADENRLSQRADELTKNKPTLEELKAMDSLEGGGNGYFFANMYHLDNITPHQAAEYDRALSQYGDKIELKINENRYPINVDNRAKIEQLKDYLTYTKQSGKDDTGLSGLVNPNKYKALMDDLSKGEFRNNEYEKTYYDLLKAYDEFEPNIKAMYDDDSFAPFANGETLGGGFFGGSETAFNERDWNNDGQNDIEDIAIGALGGVVGFNALSKMFPNWFKGENGINANKFNKEKKNILKVAQGEKPSTVIRNYDDFEITNLAKGYHNKETNKGAGLEHIMVRHMKDNSNGKISLNELTKIGEVIREGELTLKENKRVYTLLKDDIRFRAITGENKKGEKVISFYSNRGTGTGLEHDVQNYTLSTSADGTIITYKPQKSFKEWVESLEKNDDGVVIGVFGGNAPRVEKSFLDGDGFYSVLEKTIDEKTGGKIDSISLAKMLENNGIKEDEIEWSGLKELMNNNEKLTKDDIEKTISENRLVIEKVEKTTGAKYEKYKIDGGDNYRELLFKQDNKKEKGYTSKHWDEENVLVFTRVDDRTIENKKALFIEEIQSDWHQEGRKKGYEKKDVPNAPFKKNWHELGIKRLIQEAVTNDYDKLAWTTGKQQTQRYTLEKTADEIVYNKNNKVIKVSDKGKEVFFKTIASDEELEGIIGKEIANKLIKAETKNQNLFMLKGDELKFGGDGMKAFYDSILPNTVKKLFKKYNVKPKIEELDDMEEMVWSIDIPKEMKEDIKKIGQPLYAVGGSIVTYEALKGENNGEK